MSKAIKNPRNGCALHGALQTVKEIEGVVPVVHANAGCGVINALANKTLGTGEGRYSGFAIPGTTVQERHVIFGGASRLREQIKNTIKVVNGQLFVILNSCESAMVGDDVDAMTREIVEQNEPVVNTLVAGFNGDTHYGYEHVLADILRSIDSVKNNEKNTDIKLVNIFGIVPDKDAFWQGNLEEIKRIFEGVGLKANLFFGVYGGVTDLENAKNAAVSVVFSRWGELPAKVLKEIHNVPFIIEKSIPTDYLQEKDLIEKLIDYTDISKETIDSFIQSEEKYQKNYLSRIRDDIFELKFGRKVVLVGDEEQVIRYGQIIKNVFGVKPYAGVITDVYKKDEEHIADNTEHVKSILENIFITSDQKDIDDIIRKSGADIVIGSSLEKQITNKVKATLIEFSYPIYHRSILNQPLAGTRGQIRFIQEYITVGKENDIQKKLELKNYLREVKGEKYEKKETIIRGGDFISFNDESFDRMLVK